MKTLNKFAIAGALAFAASAANATVLSFEDNDNGLETTEINQTLELGLFDSSLGTLDSVELFIGGEAVTTFALINNAAQAQTVSATFSVDMLIQGPAGFATQFFGIDLVDTGFVSLAVGDTLDLGSLEAGSGVSATFAAGVDDLSIFQAVGGGALDLTCDSFSNLGVAGGGGNVVAEQATEAGCFGEIVYNFTEVEPPVDVPAPASILLLGLGLGALSLRRKVK